jgi:hypothetical protein
VRRGVEETMTGRCDGVTRRGCLALGSLTAFGLGLPDLLRLRSAAAAPAAPATACILIWLDGGPTHLDMFDLKPDAPSEVRGEFRPIETSAPGVRICEHLPRTARMMHHVALVRSLTHELGNHPTASHYVLTFNKPTPVLDYPSLGSIVARQTGLQRALPPFVTVPEAGYYNRAGYLPAAYGPFVLAGDPSRGDYRVRDLQPPVGLRLERLERRRAMVKALDDLGREVDRTAVSQSRDSFFDQAYRLTTSPEAKAAFSLDREPAALRDRYGRGRIGTSCLLARRLVAAGVRFVTVVDPEWDSHQQIPRNLPDTRFPGSGKLPSLDRAYAALLSDLHEQGLLERTLVVLMGEFGRTPKINSYGGRDHWPRAGFVCLAGAGIRGGQVIGATDAHGESPADRPVRPEDLGCTLLRKLGIDPRTEYRTSDGRPIRLVSGGEPIAELG